MMDSATSPTEKGDSKIASQSPTSESKLLLPEISGELHCSLPPSSAPPSPYNLPLPPSPPLPCSPLADARRQRPPTKTINWSKVRANEVAGSVWDEPRSFPREEMAEYLQELEVLFSTEEAPPPHGGVNVLKLLASERVSALNLFLKSYGMTPEEVATRVQRTDSRALSGDRLRLLMHFLPREKEKAVLLALKGDVATLPPAERLLALLARVPACEARVRAMLLHEELPSEFQQTELQLKLVTAKCYFVMADDGLRLFLHLALTLGNHLNKGSDAGSALGFRLTDLPKFKQIATSDSGSDIPTFLHFITKVAMDFGSDEVLVFADRLAGGLSKLQQISLAYIKKMLEDQMAEVSFIQNALKDLPVDVRKKYNEFFIKVAQQIASLQKLLKTAEDAWQSLLRFFCEDPQHVTFEEGIELLMKFFHDVKTAQTTLAQPLEYLPEPRLQSDHCNCDIQ